MTEFQQKQFLTEYAKFYDVEEKTTQKLDFNKLYQASRENKGLVNPVNIPDHLKKDTDFKKHHRAFFDCSQADTQSQYNRHNEKFYNDDPEKHKTLGSAFIDIQTSVEVEKS